MTTFILVSVDFFIGIKTLTLIDQQEQVDNFPDNVGLSEVH